MEKTILKLFLFVAFFSAMISVNANNGDSFPISENVLPYNTTWTTGSLSSRYLDFAHTTHVDEVKLVPGRYKWTLITQRRNNKKGKVNFDIKEIYKNGSNKVVVNKPRTTSGTTTSGTFTISDFKSKSNGRSAGYGKLKVHIGRAGANTNVNYKITIKKINGGSGNANNCTYSSLGTKNGLVYGQTTGKHVFPKKACKNVVNVKVFKLKGKARTTVNVYVSSTKNGVGTLKDTYEFPNSNKTANHNFRLTGVNGKFIRVELRNRSVGNTFKWKATAKQ